MSGIQSLLLVLEAAEKERDDAVSAMEAARQAHQAARQQSQSLTDWRSEYQRRWQSQFQQSGGMEIVRCYQDFTVRLGEAVSEQDRRVDLAEQQLARCRAQLIERERRVAAVSQLIERRQAELQHKRNRQEQKATDEQAARAVRMASSQGMAASGMATGTL
ncbi:MAG: flagellar export protein FliJ [Proteobacteria bacterium]|uniref:flagellar export protein FliJ n=1 Tax=Aquabacterium sp. TaxID=1872578 RepID=UPI0035C77CE7|nr:flagellar export protein FliJ [Pseudomonadota bacterium]